MASDLNVVALVGRLGADPELRGNSANVLSLRIAVNRRVKQDNEWTDVASWFDVTYFGKAEDSNRAKSLAGMVHKGDRIAVRGELEQRTWEQDGDKRSAVGVIAQDIQLLAPKGEASASAPAEAPAEQASESAPAEDTPAEGGKFF